MTDVHTRTDGGLASASPEPGGAGAAPRRVVLIGAGTLGATCLLAACGSPGNPNGSDFNTNPAPAGSKGAGGPALDSPSGTVIVAASVVPVGGGVIKGGFVVTQPAQGTFKGFSKVCTHQGCDVSRIDGGVIICPCHGSQYSIEDGSVQAGPAPKPLPPVAVKVSGKNVVKA